MNSLKVRFIDLVILSEFLSPGRCNVVKVVTVFVTMSGVFISSKVKTSLMGGRCMSVLSCSALF